MRLMKKSRFRMNREEIKKVLDFEAYYNNEDFEDIEMLDDILMMEDELVEQEEERIKKLKQLLSPLDIVDGELFNLDWFALDAAIVLTSWGYKEGLSYLNEIVSYGLKNIPNFSPHRIYNYDESYQNILYAFFNYTSRMHQRGSKTESVKQISSAIIRIIDRAKEEDISLSGFIFKLYNDDMNAIFNKPLRDTLAYIKNKKEKTFLDEYNIEDIEKALERPNLLDTIRQ